MHRTHQTLTASSIALFAGFALSPCAVAQHQTAQNAPPLPARIAQTGPISNAENGLPPALDAVTPAPHDGPVVQLALLLDTSNSMDGLIDQARAELWTVINRLQGLQHGSGDVQFQVALYQYGNDRLESADGFVQMRTPFTTDLDVLSEQLFALTTDGGSEYCGWVIGDATNELAWSEPSNADGAPPVLRMIVVAGNEPFSQGTVAYSETIGSASSKGIRVHTVFCGNDAEGVSTYWSDGASIGEGFYFSIDQDESVRFRTQYDDAILQGNTRLNSTFYNFNAQGRVGLARQLSMDMANEAQSDEQMVQRAASKASGFYGNAHWDIVDAHDKGTLKEEDIEPEALPEEWRDLEFDELVEQLELKLEERQKIQEEIRELFEKREQEVAQQREEMGVVTLGMALSSAIIDQAREQGFSHADDEKFEEFDPVSPDGIMPPEMPLGESEPDAQP